MSSFKMIDSSEQPPAEAQEIMEYVGLMLASIATHLTNMVGGHVTVTVVTSICKHSKFGFGFDSCLSTQEDRVPAILALLKTQALQSGVEPKDILAALRSVFTPPPTDKSNLN